MKVLFSSIFATALLTLLASSALVFTSAQTFPPRDTVQYSSGTISSIQDDEAGNPEWIVTGNWKGNIFAALNETNSNASDLAFNANVRMVMINGSASHTHAITNFNLTDASEENGVKTFNGTSTLNLIEGTVTGVPTSIRVLGEGVISIWIDPSRVEEHYGETPIYGVVADERGFGPGGGPGPHRR
jgi:hypothetical protein